METKWWYKTIRWFAGIVEDRPDSASSKRFGLFLALYMLYKIVMKEANTDPNVILAVVVVILVCLGTITTVNISDISKTGIVNTKTEKSSKETTTETTETK